MIFIFVKIKVRPEKRKELSQTLLSIVEHVRKENGCLHSGFYQNVEIETDFLMVQEWVTQKKAQEHLESDIFTILKGAGCLMTRPPEIVIHSINGPTKLQNESTKPITGNERSET